MEIKVDGINSLIDDISIFFTILYNDGRFDK